MKRIARLVSLLFPRRWRDRYGAEFVALLEDADLRPVDLADIFKGAIQMQSSNLRLLGAFVLAGLAVGLGAAYTIPKVYMTAASLRVENSTEDLSGTFAEVLERRWLGEMIQKHRLYEPDQSKLPLEDLVNRLQRDIIVQATKDRRTFVLQVRAASPQAATLVLKDLMRRFEDHRSRLSVLDSPLKPIVLSPHRPMVTAAGVLAGFVIGFVAVLWRRWIYLTKTNSPNLAG